MYGVNRKVVKTEHSEVVEVGCVTPHCQGLDRVKTPLTWANLHGEWIKQYGGWKEHDGQPIGVTPGCSSAPWISFTLTTKSSAPVDGNC